MAATISLAMPVHTTATTCSTANDVKFCYYEGDKGSQEIIYFLHGFTNNVEAWGWNPVTKRVVLDWDKNKVVKPHVVSIGPSPVWFFTPHKNKPQLDKFVATFETEILKRTFALRVLYGDSMGGYNALKWAQASPELFERVAVICPAFPKSYVSKDLKDGSGIWPFPAIADYFVSNNSVDDVGVTINPLNAESVQKLTKVYIAAVPNDHFGFYEGAIELKLALESLGKQVVYDEQDTYHCFIKAHKLAKFLVGNYVSDVNTPSKVK